MGENSGKELMVVPGLRKNLKSTFRGDWVRSDSGLLPSDAFSETGRVRLQDGYMSLNDLRRLEADLRNNGVVSDDDPQMVELNARKPEAELLHAVVVSRAVGIVKSLDNDGQLSKDPAALVSVLRTKETDLTVLSPELEYLGLDPVEKARFNAHRRIGLKQEAVSVFDDLLQNRKSADSYRELSEKLSEPKKSREKNEDNEKTGSSGKLDMFVEKNPQMEWIRVIFDKLTLAGASVAAAELIDLAQKAANEGKPVYELAQQIRKLNMGPSSRNDARSSAFQVATEVQNYLESTAESTGGVLSGGIKDEIRGVFDGRKLVESGAFQKGLDAYWSQRDAVKDTRDIGNSAGNPMRYIMESVRTTVDAYKSRMASQGRELSVEELAILDQYVKGIEANLDLKYMQVQGEIYSSLAQNLPHYRPTATAKLAEIRDMQKSISADVRKVNSPAVIQDLAEAGDAFRDYIVYEWMDDRQRSDYLKSAASSRSDNDRAAVEYEFKDPVEVVFDQAFLDAYGLPADLLIKIGRQQYKVETVKLLSAAMSYSQYGTLLKSRDVALQIPQKFLLGVGSLIEGTPIRGNTMKNLVGDEKTRVPAAMASFDLKDTAEVLGHDPRVIKCLDLLVTIDGRLGEPNSLDSSQKAFLARNSELVDKIRSAIHTGSKQLPPADVKELMNDLTNRMVEQLAVPKGAVELMRTQLMFMQLGPENKDLRDMNSQIRGLGSDGKPVRSVYSVIAKVNGEKFFQPTLAKLRIGKDYPFPQIWAEGGMKKVFDRVADLDNGAGLTLMAGGTAAVRSQAEAVDRFVSERPDGGGWQYIGLGDEAARASNREAVVEMVTKKLEGFVGGDPPLLSAATIAEAQKWMRNRMPELVQGAIAVASTMTSDEKARQKAAVMAASSPTVLGIFSKLFDLSVGSIPFVGEWLLAYMKGVDEDVAEAKKRQEEESRRRRSGS